MLQIGSVLALRFARKGLRSAWLDASKDRKENKKNNMEILILIFGVLAILAGIAIPIIIYIFIIRAIIDYTAKRIAVEIRKNNEELAQMIAYEINNQPIDT